MKIPLCSIGLLLSGSVFAQEYAQQLTISQSVLVGAFSEQKATQFIAAKNAVSSGATALYTAGQSVTLQPGFIAQAGSVFKATVEPVVSSLAKSDVPGLSVRAYPNPFVDQATVEYSLPLGGAVHHTLIDAKGQVVRQSEEVIEQSVGIHQNQIEGSNLPAGVYLYQLQAGSQTRTLRLVKKP